MITLWEKFDAEVQNIFVNTWTLLGKHWLDEHTTICQDGGVCKRYDQTLLPLYQLISCVLIVFSSSLANTDMAAKIQDDKRHMIYRLFRCRPRPSTPPHGIVVKGLLGWSFPHHCGSWLGLVFPSPGDCLSSPVKYVYSYFILSWQVIMFSGIIYKLLLVVISLFN